MSWLWQRKVWGPMSSLSLLVLLIASLSACAKSDNENAEPSEDKVTAIPAAEAERAKKACESYITRLCQCAKQHPEMEKECELAKGIPQALQINLDVVGAQGLTTLQQNAMQKAARQISDKCFSNDSKLDLQKCPRSDNTGSDDSSP